MNGTKFRSVSLRAPLRFRMEFLAAVTQLPLIRENWTDHLAAQDVPREWRFFTPEEK